MHRKGAVIKTSELLQAYNEWARDYDFSSMKPREFVSKLRRIRNVTHGVSGNAIADAVFTG
jgi:hypothetical protein